MTFHGIDSVPISKVTIHHGTELTILEDITCQVCGETCTTLLDDGRFIPIYIHQGAHNPDGGDDDDALKVCVGDSNHHVNDKRDEKNILALLKENGWVK